MLQPKRSKHRKQQKGRIREVAKRGTAISFGSFALKALEPIAVVEPGRIIFECDGVSQETAKEAMKLAAQKLPIATKFVIRRDLQA